MSTILNRRALVGSAIALGAFCAVNPTQALGVTAAQRRVDGERSAPQGQVCPLGQQQGIHTLLLRQSQNGLAQRVIRLHIREHQQTYLHPLQQPGNAVGVVLVIVGEHHHVDAAQAHALEVVGGNVSRVIHSAAATVHQGGSALSVDGGGQALTHIQH